MKNKGFATVSLHERGIAHVIVLVLVVLGIGAMGYFSWKGGYIKIDPTPSKTLTPSEIAQTPQLSPTPDPTVGWETYTNTKYGFSFKYPDTVEVAGQEESDVIYSGFAPLNLPENWDSMVAPIEIVYNKERLETVTQRLASIFFEKEGFTKTPITLPGRGYKISGQPGPGPYPNSRMDMYLFEIPNMSGFIQINFSSGYDFDENLFNQILSTFRFESADDIPVGWSIKSFEKCGIQFALPSSIADKDNRTWGTYQTTANPFGIEKLKGDGISIMHKSPDEASGFISGLVTINCGVNPDQLTNSGLVNLVKNELEDYRIKNNNSTDIIQVSSFKETKMWNIDVAEVYFEGGMATPTQPNYYFVKNGKWYMISGRSDSESAKIKDDTQKILNSIRFK